jgi:uncharacterized protein
MNLPHEEAILAYNSPQTLPRGRIMSTTVFDDHDLARLEHLLNPLSAAGSTMRPDEVQGFFAALISGPDEVDPDFWWSEVLGDAPEFSSDAERDELRALLEKLYFATADALAATEPLDLILYAEEDSDDADYWPWCNAYLYALDSVPTDWFEKADDEGFEELLLPVMALGGMFEEDDGDDLVDFSPEELEDFRDQLPMALQSVFNYWHAKANAPTTVRREGDKVGRNDPCPCGSGKKYKACCGRDE